MAKNKPTILVITGGYFPGVDFGGIATSRYNFSQALGDDYDIAIVTRNHDYKTATPYENIKDGWNEYGKGRVLYLSDEDFCEKSFLKIIEETAPIVMYLSGTITSYFYFNKDAIRAAKKKNVPVLLTPDGDVCTNAMRIKAFKKFTAAAICRLTGAFRDVWFQSTSDDEARNLALYLGVRKERIALLSNLPSQVKPRDGYKKPRGCLNLVFSSRIHPKKNLYYALELVSKLKALVTFDIYGSMEDNQYWQKCEEVISSMPENVKVSYKGRVDANQAREVARDYDAFLFPTLSENYGYVIEEALLCGCPVIISCGTTPWDDVDGNGGAALDLETPDAFVAELNKIAGMDTDEYVEYTKNLNEYITQKLSYDKLVSDYKVLIEKVAASKNNERV